MARQLSEIYEFMISEDFLKEELKEGLVPLPVEIEREKEKHRIQTDNFTKPLFQSAEHTIPKESSVSASKFNTAMNAVLTDLRAVYLGLADQGVLIKRMYETASSILESQAQDLDVLSEELAGMLFESGELDLYEDLFYEKFDNKSMVESALTTALVNVNTTQVELLPKTTDLLNFNFNEADFSFAVTQESFLRESLPINGMGILNAFSSEDAVWQHKVSLSQDIPQVDLVMELRVPDSSKMINQIIIEPAEASNKTSLYCEIHYSSDRLNWTKVSGEWNKRVLKQTSFSFKGITPKFFRFKFKKKGVDVKTGDSFYYFFGAKSISFIGKSYQIKKRALENTLYTKPITPRTLDYISNAGFLFCQEIPGVSAISYSVFLLNESQMSNYAPGVLASVPEYQLGLVEKAKVVNLDMKSLLEEDVTISGVQYDASTSFEYQTDNNSALNIDTSSIERNHLEIFRGEGSNASSTIQGLETTMLGEPLGWTLEGAYYQTIIHVTEYAGFSFNLGTTTAFLNDKRITGRVTIKAGKYRFRTHRQNWSSIDLSDLTQDRIGDPLYPFNHKMLIEGLGETLYRVDLLQDRGGWTVAGQLDPQGVYPSQRKYWARKLKEKQAFNFFTEGMGLDSFTYTLDNEGIEKIIVNCPDKDARVNSETFYVETKMAAEEPVKGIVIKALLSTEDPEVSPILKEYVVRMK